MSLSLEVFLDGSYSLSPHLLKPVVSARQQPPRPGNVLKVLTLFATRMGNRLIQAAVGGTADKRLMQNL